MLPIVRGIAAGYPIPSPAYVDANVLVSYFVRRPNTPAAVGAIAETLAQDVEAVLSPLTITEFWWGILDALYNRARAGRGEPPQRLTAGELRRHHASLLAVNRAEIALIREQLRTWPRLRSVAFRPAGFRRWLSSFDGGIDAANLLPSDLAHLALAVRHARCLITADRGFARAALRTRTFTIIIV
jgi:predicted nucleic acid-binding protein